MVLIAYRWDDRICSAQSHRKIDPISAIIHTYNKTGYELPHLVEGIRAMKRMNYTIKLTVIISAVLLLANILLGGILLGQSKTSLKLLIDEHIQDISTIAADMIDGDVLKRLNEEDKDTAEYQEMYNTLHTFQLNTNVRFIYAARQAEDGTFYMVLDPADAYASEYGEVLFNTEALQRAGQGIPGVDATPYTDDYGSFYSAYSPVFDSNGEVAGVIGTDFSAEWYENEISKRSNTILLSSLISVIIGALIAATITGQVRKEFREMNDELDALTSDLKALTSEFSGSSAALEEAGSRETIEDLGETIHRMKTDVQSYVGSLQTRANSMITALGSDYRSLYYIDLDKNEGICYQAIAGIDNGLQPGQEFSYWSELTRYAEEAVTSQYREAFLEFMSPDAIKEGLKNDRVISFLYTVERNGIELYERVRVAGVRHPEDRDDHIVHAVGLGFEEVDAETRKSVAQAEALRNALAAAEEANRAKTSFLSNMSHEIRTPMNAIIGLDNIALSDPDISESTREHLEKIDSSAHHLLSIINDILDMSRIESGRMVIKSEEFSFARMLAQVNTIINGQCNDKGLNYECRIIGDVRDYYIGDDMKLRQVMINILGNAVKFTPEGGSVVLTVESLARFNGKATLCMTFRDTGIGMSKEYLPNLFDAFSQEDSSSTSKYGSTGLGMPITKSIVELMNGNIEVESEKGVGSVFTVTLTLLDSDRKSDETEEVLHSDEMCVLVIDDDPIACEHAQMVLGQVGISCEKALSGEEGLDMVKVRHARREPYNLILVDWKMPEMDGVETTRRIREAVGEETPVIILTSYSWEEIEIEAREAGVDSFVAKPLFAGTVMDEFREAFNQKNMRNIRHTADLNGRRILLAEDVDINAEIIIMLLSMREMSAERAENGRIAVELFASHDPGYYDAILMDMRMPEMDGLEATRTIRAMDRSDAKDIPIIALTANAFDEDVQRSMQAGLNAHLSKPVEPDSLFATLEGLIR